MKLIHIKDAFKSSDLELKSIEEKNYVSIFTITDYIKLVAYHDADKDVDSLDVIAVVGVGGKQHYNTIVKSIDMVTRLLTNLTTELRTQMYESINLGEINKTFMDLETFTVDYKLAENGLLEYKLVVKDNIFFTRPPTFF